MLAVVLHELTIREPSAESRFPDLRSAQNTDLIIIVHALRPKGGEIVSKSKERASSERFTE